VTRIREVHPIAILTGDFFEQLSNAPDPSARFADDGEEPNLETDLVLWVIHNRLTSDHPGVYVMRREWVHRDPSGPVRVVDRRALCHYDLAPLRARLPPGLHCLPHQPGEDFTIEETWL